MIVIMKPEGIGTTDLVLVVTGHVDDPPFIFFSKQDYGD